MAEALAGCLDCHVRVFCFIEDERGDWQITLSCDFERRERMAQAAEIGARDEDYRNFQRRDEIAHRRLRVERHHQAADAFDEQHVIGFGDRVGTEATNGCNVDGLAFLRRRHIGRERRCEAPGRNRCDCIEINVAPAGFEQRAAIAA